VLENKLARKIIRPIKDKNKYRREENA